jgi:HAD superfamily hydrolase (TIGR01484 family)
MRQYKMIAIDLDGTLLNPRGNVSDQSRDAVRRALDAGLLVCFATGRNWTESKPVLDAVAHYDCAVFVGGAMVIDTKNEVVLHRTLMGPQLAREVSAFLEDRGQCVLALQDTTQVGYDYLVTGDIPMNAATRMWMEIAKAGVHEFPRLAGHAHEHTVRIGIVAPATEAESIGRDVAVQFGPRIVSHSIGVPMHEMTIVEVFDPAVNKWQGILHVAARHGIAAHEIIAIGDDVNDLPMLAEAGLGVAMGNAKPEAKAVSKRVIGSNRDEGLATFLDELVSHHTVTPLAEIERGQRN